MTPLELGFNIDIVGIGTVGSTSASYLASTSASSIALQVTPALFNVFAGGSSDRGSLKSEFYAGWRATSSLTVRGGLTNFLPEYKTSRTLSKNTDRFRIYANLEFLGVRWTPNYR